MTLPREDITGLVLAGGRATRMGGVDKGLLPFAGTTLAAHALARLAPQVGPLAVNANRHLDTYRSLGVPVWPDALPDHPGPLAGMLAGLVNCSTPWLATVPCDTPGFAPDLVARLAAAAQREGANVAMACSQEGGEMQRQPVFCLLARELASELALQLAAGQRKIDRWMLAQRCVQVVFEDPAGFFNINTPEELAQAQAALAGN
jgi:molybdenum cofactor guanylyltransferase